MLEAEHQTWRHGSEVTGALGLAGSIQPVTVTTRVLVHPPLPWET